LWCIADDDDARCGVGEARRVDLKSSLEL